MLPDNLHEWFKPEDDFGPIAGLRECRRCGALWWFFDLEDPPQRDGCPAERGRAINREKHR